MYYAFLWTNAAITLITTVISIQPALIMNFSKSYKHYLLSIAILWAVLFIILTIVFDILEID